MGRRVTKTVSGKVSVGMHAEGWTCRKEYAHFFLWDRKTRLGEVIRCCCAKNEIPLIEDDD